MTKLLAGVITILVLGLALTGGLLYEQIGQTAKAADAAREWETAAGKADDEAKAASKRGEDLNIAMKSLAVKKLASDLLASERESEINNLKKSEGDSNETISCLDQPVPAELSRVLNAK